MSNLQLSNSANWVSFYSQSFTARQITSTYWAPLAEITVPILLDRHILAVYVTSNTAKDTWYFAGYLNQKLQLGLMLGGTPEADAVKRRRIWLNRITLIILPKLTDDYAISFNIPRWYKDVNLTVWKYVGPENEPLEDILQRIETKIDAIDE